MKMIYNLTKRLVTYEARVNGDRQRELQLNLARCLTTYVAELPREDYVEFCREFPELQYVNDFWDDLSDEAKIAIHHAGVKTLGDLADYTRDEFNKAQRLNDQFHEAGEKILEELRTVLLKPRSLDYKETQ